MPQLHCFSKADADFISVVVHYCFSGAIFIQLQDFRDTDDIQGGPKSKVLGEAAHFFKMPKTIHVIFSRNKSHSSDHNF